MTITIPYKFVPRTYQLPILDAMDSGFLRAVQVWHRKSGKEKVDWNLIIKKSQERVGNYWYIFPKLTQARKVVWEGIDQDGMGFLEHIPRQILDGEPNSTIMFVRFKNGSTIQLIGSDTFDTSIGGNPVGVVFSEYALTDPYVWSYLRPILANNGGWAVFNFTPRGENHAFQLYNLAKSDPKNWFAQVLTVDDTHAIPKEILNQERKEIIELDGNDALFQQEYYCSFTVPIAGAYYSGQIMQAYKEGRISNVPHDPSFPVDTWWDLGINDKMSIWLTQSIGAELRLIDYEEGVGMGMDSYIKKLKEKSYIYGTHTGPHDLRVRELSSGVKRIDVAASLGFEFQICPNIPITDGIDAARRMWKKIWIDSTKCALGINALKNYVKQYDETRKTYSNSPLHNWASNAADAFRYMAVGLNFEYSVINGQPDLVKKVSTAGAWMNPRYR